MRQALSPAVSLLSKESHKRVMPEVAGFESMYFAMRAKHGPNSHPASRMKCGCDYATSMRLFQKYEIVASRAGCRRVPLTQLFSIVIGITQISFKILFPFTRRGRRISATVLPSWHSYNSSNAWGLFVMVINDNTRQSYNLE